MKNLSPICFGCEPLGGTDNGYFNYTSISKAINIAIDLGINFFDTAGVYGLGLSEKRLSKILGKRRHNLMIATKGGLSWNKVKSGRSVIVTDSSPLAIRKDVESSLSRLGLETLPIFFIHWPDKKTAFEETFTELVNLKNEGKIRAIGCSNFSAQQLQEACTFSKIDYLQIPINLLNNPLSTDISKICDENKIKIVAYNTLAHGLLAGKLNQNSVFLENDRRSRLSLFKGAEFINALKKVDDLKLLCINLNTNLLQYSISWVLKQQNVCSAIIGIKDHHQVKENSYNIL